jgi:phospholipase/carboxylesterase
MKEEPRMPARLALLGVVLALAACRDAGEHVSPIPDFVERRADPRRPTAAPPPLLVLLHGIGTDENDLFPLAQAVDPRFAVVSLRAPGDYHGGYAWFHIDFLAGGRVRPDLPQARASLARLIAWIESTPARLGTDPRRTFLLGFSQGAMMALGALGEVPERLAGVVALSGRAPGELFEPRASREAIARVPLLVAHGSHDDVLPVESGRTIRAAFAPLSHDFTYREFPIGHGISDEELALVADWLAAHLD